LVAPPQLDPEGSLVSRRPSKCNPVRMSAFVKFCPVRTGQTKQNGCGGDMEMLGCSKF
jgi:hypothetical protein